MAKHTWNKARELLETAAKHDSSALSDADAGTDLVSTEEIYEMAREAGIRKEAIRKVIESDRENVPEESEAMSTNYSESSELTLYILLVGCTVIMFSMSMFVLQVLDLDKLDFGGTEKIESPEANTPEQ